VQPDERKRFVELLQGLAQSGLVWVIATMRADFWHRAGETPELVKLADGNGRLDLLPPTPAELSQMIRGPADAALIHFEVSGATHIPLNDLIAQEAAGEPGALPLLSFVLAQLYQRDVQDRGGDTLTYASYEALGGLRGAIATRAEAVMAAQPQDVRSALRQVLFSLVQMSEGEGSVEHAVARRAPLSNFPPGTAKRKLIDAFLDPSARLLVADAAAGPSATVRLAHEALLSHWEAARRYVAENLEALKSRRFIEEQYKHWQEHRSQSPAKQAGANGRPRSVLAGLRALFAPEQGLLSGLELTGAERLSRDYSDELAPELVDYIQRSLDQDRQRDRRTERIAYAVAGVFLVLSVLSGIAWWIASDQRDLARSEAATTDRTTTFMESLFESANPETNRGVDITVSKWLDNGATDLEQSSQQAPRVRAELLTAIGQAYSGLGSYAKAEDLLLRARQAQEAPNALIPNESRARTMVASGMAGYLAGHYDQAVGFQRAAVDLTRHEPLKSTVLRSEALTGLADALVAQGIHEEAIKLCLEALAADRKRRPEDAAVLANTLSSLAGAYFFEDNLKAAEAPLREALSLREHVFGLNHALTGESMLDLAALLHQLGHDNEAIEEFQKALPIYRQVYGDKHPDLATLLNDLGRSELMVGRIDDAEQHLRQSLAMSRQFESEDHDNLVAPLNSLGMIDTYRGRTDAAASELAEAESIAGKRAHSDLLDQVLLDKADLEIVTGHPALAEASLTKSKQLLQATYRNDTNNAWRYAVWDMIHVHLLAASNNNTAEAQQTLVAAESVVRQRFGANGFYSQLAERIAQSIKQTAIRAMWDKEMLASDEECGAAFWTDPSRWHVEFVV
jgi:tetratricopeptide (TPR) repeat protein